MINIISTVGKQAQISGPGKVFFNLIKGLDKIGYPYVLNHDLNSTKRLWVHDTQAALYEMKRSRAFIVVGPNLYVMPDDISPSIDLEDALYLHPSDWVKKLWEHVGFMACPIKVWPVGVDTDLFCPSAKQSVSKRVLIYHKKRDSQELTRILEVMSELSLPYTLISYGEYHENEYINALNNALFVIWHGCHESQGLAFQEALACDVPILIYDATRLSLEEDGYRFSSELDIIPVTSAPYFDNTCGMKFSELADLKSSVESMLERLPDFSPREFVLKNLSLEKQAYAFVALWEHWGLTFEQGLGELLQVGGGWHIPLSTKIRMKVERKTRFAKKTMDRYLQG